MQTVAELQDEFRKNFKYNPPKKSQMASTGEINTWLMRVYKLSATDPWCFKAAIPVSAHNAFAVANYLAGLEEVMPDHVSPKEQMEAAGELKRGAASQ